MLASYCAAKHAALGFVRSLAADLGGIGVTANAVCPGTTDTAMLAATAAVYGLAVVAATSPGSAHRPAARAGRGRRRGALAGVARASRRSPAPRVAVDGGFTG